MSYTDYKYWKERPISSEPYLSVVIPAYNEAERILPTLGAIAAHVSAMNIPWELIVVNDGSVDNTADLVTGIGFANLRLINQENGGKGSAVRRGILAARGQYVLFDDADNSTPIEEIDKLLYKLQNEEYDVAIGSRAAAGASESKRSPTRRILSAGLRWLVRHIFRINFRDTQCGFKIYTRAAARRLYKLQTIRGFSFDLEILYLSTKLGLRIAEVPVEWIDAPGSKVDPRKEAHRFLRDLLKIRLNDLRGIYLDA